MNYFKTIFNLGWVSLETLGSFNARLIKNLWELQFLKNANMYDASHTLIKCQMIEVDDYITAIVKIDAYYAIINNIRILQYYTYYYCVSYKLPPVQLVIIIVQ